MIQLIIYIIFCICVSLLGIRLLFCFILFFVSYTRFSFLFALNVVRIRIRISTIVNYMFINHIHMIVWTGVIILTFLSLLYFSTTIFWATEFELCTLSDLQNMKVTLNKINVVNNSELVSNMFVRRTSLADVFNKHCSTNLSTMSFDAVYANQLYDTHLLHTLACVHANLCVDMQLAGLCRLSPETLQLIRALKYFQYIFHSFENIDALEKLANTISFRRHFSMGTIKMHTLSEMNALLNCSLADKANMLRQYNENRSFIDSLGSDAFSYKSVTPSWKGSAARSYDRVFVKLLDCFQIASLNGYSEHASEILVKNCLRTKVLVQTPVVPAILSDDIQLRQLNAHRVSALVVPFVTVGLLVILSK